MKVGRVSIVSQPCLTQWPDEGDEASVVVPPGEDIESDDEAADAAHDHMLRLDAMLARSLSLNLRPRK